MNIISKFQDYYDAIGYIYGSYGEGHRFVRNTTDATDDEFGTYSSDLTPTAGDFKLSFGVVGFCGKLYPNIRIAKLKKTKSLAGGYELVHYDTFWSSSKAKEYISTLPLDKEEHKKLMRKLFRATGKYPLGSKLTINRLIDMYFEDPEIMKTKLKRASADPDKLFENSPIFSLGYSSFYTEKKASNPTYRPHFSLNPYLSDMGFIEAVSAEQAYQEIEMWLGKGCTEYSDPNDGIGDKYLAAGKGYDCMSFRKRGPKSSC